ASSFFMFGPSPNAAQYSTAAVGRDGVMHQNDLRGAGAKDHSQNFSSVLKTCVYRKLKLGHNGDAVRQGSRGNGYFQLVELGARKARPSRASDAFAIHYNGRHRRLVSDAGALRPV